jgi:hypothetical protein
MSDSERVYPCDDCGILRTKAEGGTVFTVCDACWDKLHPDSSPDYIPPLTEAMREVARLTAENAELRKERNAAHREYVLVRSDMYNAIAERDAALARVAELERERDEARERLRFTHAVFVSDVSKGSARYEPDDSLRPGSVYRIVLDEDARRYAEDYKTTARPPYIATVYSHDDAVFFAWAVSNMENWLRHYNKTEQERDSLAAEVARLTEEIERLTFARESR